MMAALFLPGPLTCTYPQQGIVAATNRPLLVCGCFCREPAKYVATLRYLQQQQQQKKKEEAANGVNGSSSSSSSSRQQQRPLLLLTDLEAGHFAASGAASKLEERATKVAFLLANLEGC
jgi:protease II